MPNRAAKLASAVFASVLAGATLTAMPRGAAAADGADDECLSTPKGETPQGSHWYYRIDRSSKRQCWYLREESETTANLAPPKPSSSVRPNSIRTEAAMQPVMANARAELPPQPGNEQPRNEKPNREDRSVAAITANAPLSEADRILQPSLAETRSSAVHSRRLDPSNGLAATSALPTDRPAANDAYAGAEVSTASQPQPLSPAAAGQLAAPDLPAENRTHSVQMLLAAILGALAVAGVMGRLIFNFVGTRRRAKRRSRGRRRAIWKSPAPGRRAAAIYHAANALPQPQLPRDLDQVDEPDDRIVELLRDFSRKTRGGPNPGQSRAGSFL